MDPLSITAACVSLAATITKVSISLSTFVRSVRAARNDLDAVSRELASLKTLLELLAEDAKDVTAFPEALRKQISGIISNCNLVLAELQRLLDKYDGPGATKAAKWAIGGSDDVTKLRLSLEAHKSALELALEMVSLSITRDIRADTGELRNDTAAIKDDTAQILQEIARLRAQLPDGFALPSSGQPGSEPDYILSRYLDQLTSYAETVVWSGHDSDTHVEDDVPSRENSPDLPLHTPHRPSLYEHTKMARNEPDPKSDPEGIQASRSTPGDIMGREQNKTRMLESQSTAREKAGAEMRARHAFQQRNASPKPLPLRRPPDEAAVVEGLAEEIPRYLTPKSQPATQPTLQQAPHNFAPVPGEPIEMVTNTYDNYSHHITSTEKGSSSTTQVTSADLEGWNLEEPTTEPLPVVPSQPATQSEPASVNRTTKQRTTITSRSGTWAIGKTIGAGEVGKVKLGKNATTGELVAMKIIQRMTLSERLQSARDRERKDQEQEIKTAREAAVLSLLDHPYICGSRDVVRTNYHWFILLEYVGGGTLQDYVTSHGKLKEKQARKFARQIGSALDYCHHNNIVHRGLKLDDILLTSSGDIKLADFGDGNLVSSASELHTLSSSAFCPAPETLSLHGPFGHSYEGKPVDIWGFGVVLFIMLAGYKPFQGTNIADLHSNIGKSLPYPLPLNVSSESKSLIQQMLAHYPESRSKLPDILCHPWMTKGFIGLPENYIYYREPLRLPLDENIISKMTGFDFGTPEYILHQLIDIVQSKEYQDAARLWHSLDIERRVRPKSPTPRRRRSAMFQFFERKKEDENDAAPNPWDSPHCAALSSSPMLAVYYLVREKMEREAREQSNQNGH